MISDLDEIRRRTESNEAENLAFRRHLIAHHQPLEPFRILANEIQANTDCTACANCCREMIVNVSPAEIHSLAAHLGISDEDVAHLYTEPDPEDHSRRILRNQNSCVFLDGNLCMVYAARPKACHDFPHIALHSSTVGNRMSSFCRSAAVCPIIYNALEAYKHLVGYRYPGKANSVPRPSSH